MNYLAHLYLAEPTPASLIGNLIADFVKGRNLEHLPSGVAQGVRLHRRVDSFTDYHSIVQRSIGRISNSWGWFSGILIDVYYDHILATTWREWSSESLRDYVDRIHRCLSDHSDLAPPDSRVMIARLIETDRLATYATLNGIREALLHLSHRIRERMPGRDVHLEHAMPELQESMNVLTADFREFFPNLVRHAESVKQAQRVAEAF